MDNSSAAAVVIFVIFAPLFRCMSGQRFFIDKESEFSLIRRSESGQFADDYTDIRKSSLPIEYLLPIGGAWSSVSCNQGVQTLLRGCCRYKAPLSLCVLHSEHID